MRHEKEQEMEERRDERDDDLRGKREGHREGARPVNQCQTKYIVRVLLTVCACMYVTAKF